MRGSSLLPKQFRSLGQTDSWLYRLVTSQLVAVSHLVCQFPIPTIVIIALLASTSYVGLLQDSLFDASVSFEDGHGHVDLASILIGSRNVELSQSTGWKWQFQDTDSHSPSDNNIQHLALTTLNFPDSLTSEYAPDRDWISLPRNVTATSTPSTSNLLSSISQDTTLAYYMPYEQVADFLYSVQEVVPPPEHGENVKWTMKAAQSTNGGSSSSYAIWFSEGWTKFVDLFKVYPLLLMAVRMPRLTPSSMLRHSISSS